MLRLVAQRAVALGRQVAHGDFSPIGATSYTIQVYDGDILVARYYNSKPKFHECDVLLCPPGLERFGAFNTRHVQEIFDIGYREASAHLGAIEAALEAIVS
ncbi:MAG: hypothetical protein GY719_29950 [bacterium]|nr:hypothetical protein [bacterium]